MMLYLPVGIEPLTLDHVSAGDGLQKHQHAVYKTILMPRLIFPLKYAL